MTFIRRVNITTKQVSRRFPPRSSGAACRTFILTLPPAFVFQDRRPLPPPANPESQVGHFGRYNQESNQVYRGPESTVANEVRCRSYRGQCEAFKRAERHIRIEQRHQSPWHLGRDATYKESPRESGSSKDNETVGRKRTLRAPQEREKGAAPRGIV